MRYTGIFPATTCHRKICIIPTLKTGWIFYFWIHNNIEMVGVFFISSTSISVTSLQRITLSPVTLTNYNRRWIRMKKNRFLRQINSSSYLKLCTTWSRLGIDVPETARVTKKKRSRACFFIICFDIIYAHLMILCIFVIFIKLYNW